MSNRSVSEVHDCLVEFQKFLAPDIGLLQLSKPYRILRNGNEDCDWDKPYREIWGQEPEAGVYLHFDADDTLIYVGTAVSIGRRLARYYQYEDPRTRAGCRIDPVFAQAGLVATRAVFFNEGVKYLAPSLEWYLIEKLDPPLNKQRRQSQATAAEPSSVGSVQQML